jgi:putative membrane protein
VTRRGFVDEPVEPAREAAASRSAPLADPPPVDRGWIDAAPEGPEGPIRHTAVAVLPGRERTGGMQPITVGCIALLLLLAGVALLEVGNFVAGQFAASAVLGWLTVGVVAPAIGLLGWSIAREWRGYAQLRDVDTLRRDLASEDLATARAAARTWLESVGVRTEIERVIAGAGDAATLRALLRSGPLVELNNATAEAGRTAALQVLAATAVSPWPGLDGVIVTWRGMRLVRRIAALHGLRPGFLGTMRIFRRVALDAGTVAAADIAAAALTEALFSSPAVGGLIGQATGSAVAGRRMLRLAYAVAKACQPI